MKRIFLYIMLMLCLFSLVGCKNMSPNINPKEVEVNTILFRVNGKVQAFFVEDFEKSYYSESELRTFIDENIESYNLINGKDAIKLDYLKVKNKVASAICTYADTEKYCDFNGHEAYFLTAAEANDNSLIPSSFIDADKGDTFTKEEVLKNDKFKVVMIKEPMDVMVDGTIKYYSNGILLNKNTVQSAEEGYTVIVFK